MKRLPGVFPIMKLSKLGGKHGSLNGAALASGLALSDNGRGYYAFEPGNQGGQIAFRCI